MTQPSPQYQDKELSRLFSRAVAMYSKMPDKATCIDILFAVPQDCDDAIKLMNRHMPGLISSIGSQITADESTSLEELARSGRFRNHNHIQIAYTPGSAEEKPVEAFWSKYANNFNRTFVADYLASLLEPIPKRFPSTDGEFADEKTGEAYLEWLKTAEGRAQNPVTAAIQAEYEAQDVALAAIRQRRHQELS